MQRKQRQRSRNNPNKKRLVKAPAAQNKSSRQLKAPPSMYKECERIMTITGKTSFGIVDSLRVNPGLPETFPWLSGLANLFEKYKFHRLVFRFKNLKGTSSAGNILLSFDYDTLDSAPTSAIEMTQSTIYVDGAPWRVFELEIPVGDLPYLYTRSGNVASSDLKTYDIGRLHIGAEGCADTTDHGYLEVEYHVSLKDKQPLTSGNVGSGDIAVFNLSANQAINTTTANLNFNEEVVNTLGITNTSGVYTVPSGSYLVHVNESNDSTYTTIQVLKDGAAMTIPVLMGGTSSKFGTGSFYVTDTTSFTIAVSITTGAATNFLQDSCRIIFLLL